MRFFLALVAALTLAACGNAQNEAQAVEIETAPASGWVVDKETSSVIFRGKQEGETFEGRFASFDAAITLDPANLAGASIRAVIDMSSFEAGDGDRNAALPGKDWFHVKKHPEAVFASSAITQTGDGQYEAAGSLTIKGVSKDITLPFSLNIDGDTAAATGNLTLIRTDYNVGEGPYEKGTWVDLNVEVEITINATKAGA
jgi:polyisoprenoid-binding protein YceI